jgi:hypothetical protein
MPKLLICFQQEGENGSGYWQVVFLEAWWINTKEENPNELLLGP